MSDAQTLSGKTIFMSGGSRGIGLAIAKRAARGGANVVIAAKTAEPHPKLPGTIHTAAAEIEEAGGQEGVGALGVVCDIRHEEQVNQAVQQAVDRFGGIDIVVNNASAISLTDTARTEMKRYDLMNSINARGTFLVTKVCLEHLTASGKADRKPHVLNIAPPLDMDPKWFAPHVAYTIAKMGMSLCTLGHAREFARFGIAVNSLWPLTAIDTAAVRNVLGGDAMAKTSRTPEIMADAAFHVLADDPERHTGQFLIDEEVLIAAGVTDLGQYAPHADGPLTLDFFVPDEVVERSSTSVTENYA